MLSLDGRSLSLAAVERVASGAETDVRLDPAARERMAACRRYVEGYLERGERAYGVTTGFGRLSEVVIPESRRIELQVNLVRSHAAGAGERMEPADVRATMLTRANALARGHSGCRVEVVERLLEFLREGVHPRVPAFGSVGASGDLAPLAAVALALIGEGEAELEGEVLPTAEALERTGLAPLELREKEGLALINGTQAVAGPGALVLLAAERAMETAEVAAAMTSEGLRTTPEPFRAEVQEARPHPGQGESAGRLRRLLRDSEIRESHRHDDPRVHDSYSIRCIPQVHGAARETLGFVRRKLEVEINSSTDNPLVFPEADTVVSAGNFHAQILAQALDYLTIALVDVAAMSERRIEQLLNPDLSDLPAFLAGDPGVESGFMIAQVTAADFLSEMRVLAHPASVDSVSTGASKEDHVSMSPAALRKAGRAVRCMEGVLAVELMCGAQALDLLRPLRAGLGVERAWERVREVVSALEGDRPLTADVETLWDRVRAGDFAELAGGEEGG